MVACTGGGVATGMEANRWIPDPFWTWWGWRGREALVRDDCGVCKWWVALQSLRREEREGSTLMGKNVKSLVLARSGEEREDSERR